MNRINLKLALITILLLNNPKSIAQDGYALFSSCQNVKYLQEQVIDTQTSAFEAGYCLGVVYGVYATLTKVDQQGRICLPVLGISNQKKVELVLAHLKSNPSHLKQEDIVLILDAFQKAYPCIQDD